MVYVLAVLVSPWSVFSCGRPRRAMFNLVLWAVALSLAVTIGFVPALLVPIVDALLVLDDHQRAERRIMRRMSAGAYRRL